MKIINWINKIFYRILLPVFGNKKVIYSVKGSHWWAFYATDIKKWVFVKGTYHDLL